MLREIEVYLRIELLAGCCWSEVRINPLSQEEEEEEEDGSLCIQMTSRTLLIRSLISLEADQGWLLLPPKLRAFGRPAGVETQVGWKFHPCHPGVFTHQRMARMSLDGVFMGLSCSDSASQIIRFL